ncbi:MAG: pyridoxamine 5'-phosphate oxidase family protein [Thermodesulfobacteriota bacterium]
MRRNDREITDREIIDDIIRRCRVCRLAMCDQGRPYIVPLSFGYDGEAIYFHAAFEGRKIDILARNNRVCFEFDILNEVITADQACNWGMRYESVIGFGDIRFLDDPEEKRRALEWIMRQYGSHQHLFPDSALTRTRLLRLQIDDIRGKIRP